MRTQWNRFTERINKANMDYATGKVDKNTTNIVSSHVAEKFGAVFKPMRLNEKGVTRKTTYKMLTLAEAKELYGDDKDAIKKFKKQRNEFLKYSGIKYATGTIENTKQIIKNVRNAIEEEYGKPGNYGIDNDVTFNENDWKTFKTLRNLDYDSDEARDITFALKRKNIDYLKEYVGADNDDFKGIYKQYEINFDNENTMKEAETWKESVDLNENVFGE